MPGVAAHPSASRAGSEVTVFMNHASPRPSRVASREHP
ncbi:Hypothetical protein I596_394 [Dokdonella koreensis DS-123]|uniref:Uncharacterized protein n=1 Tax=Dokdonella koreensis DS-123 TaxID=1300342 RepID=A0A167GD51_9GAMM|nr:Hypothetical protein I596_394 [Dokdonella koreensis DS-123]